MKNLNKIIISFLSLLLSLNTINAGFLSESLGNSFKSLSENILFNSNAQIGIFFIAILIGMFAMFKGLLRVVFKSVGDFHQKEITVISFMISLIGSSGLFYMFKDKGQDYIINLFGGTFGLLLVIIIAILIFKTFLVWAHSAEEGSNFRKLIYVTAGILSLGLVLSYLTFLSEKLGGTLPNYLTSIYGLIEDVFTLAVFAGIILLFMSLGTIFGIKNNLNSEEKANPGIGELRKLLKLADSEMSKVNDYFKDISAFLKNKHSKLK